MSICLQFVPSTVPILQDEIALWIVAAKLVASTTLIYIVKTFFRHLIMRHDFSITLMKPNIRVINTLKESL